MKKENEIEQELENVAPEDAMKRQFLAKFGKLAAVAPVGMFMLMGPTQSKANSSVRLDGGR